MKSGARKKRRMIVTDIDGTLLKSGRPTAGLETLKSSLRRNREEVALAYVTGRSFRSTMELVKFGILPMPDAIASQVGTEVWFPQWNRPDPFYTELIRHDWNKDAVTYFAEKIPGLKPQVEEFQTQFKVSFLIESKAKVFALEKLLQSALVKTRVVYSCGKYVDIIPALAGKHSAVEYLRRVWEIPPSRILTAGNSGNDLDMLLDPDTLNVAVGNSEEEVRQFAGTGAFYSALRPFAAGILEGASKLGFNFGQLSHRRAA